MANQLLKLYWSDMLACYPAQCAEKGSSNKCPTHDVPCNNKVKAFFKKKNVFIGMSRLHVFTDIKSRIDLSNGPMEKF